MTVDLNNKRRRRRISAEFDDEEEKDKYQRLSINQSVITINNNKKRRIRFPAKDEEGKGTPIQQYLSNMFPNDVMFDILLRLPVKTLMRFRSVSKSWNYLIRKDQLFINMHLSHAKLQHEKIILTVTDYECDRMRTVYSLDYNQGSNRLERVIRRISSRLSHIYRTYNFIWGSCNGLICTGVMYCQQNLLIISNPSTTEYRKLKVPHCKKENEWLDEANYSCYGFGYNPNTNDYVVVQLTRLEEKGFLSAVSIYSLRNNSWKKIQNIPYQASDLHQPGQFVNGSLHWVSHSKFIQSGNPISNAILAFEITTENFVEVPCPDDHHGIMTVSQYQGKLCFYLTKGINSSSLDLWVMNEYQVRESWTKVFNILKPQDLNYLIRQIGQIVVCSTKEGSIIMSSTMTEDEHLILYDPKRRTHRLILGIRSCGAIYTYVPSIVALDFN